MRHSSRSSQPLQLINPTASLRLAPLMGAILLAMFALAFTATPAAAQQDSFSGNRPELPNEETFGTEHFLIHYTRTGEAAVNSSDANANGVPDYVEQVAEALEFSWQIEVDRYGWAPPPPDNGKGGDDRVDVYLENLMSEGYAGYAESQGGYVGDNPLTPELERRASSSYMALDNDYIEIADEVDQTGETPLELMQATVAHEFNHVLQAGYDDFDPHFWLYEATATWMEDEVFDDVNDGVFYLDTLFDGPDICLIAEVGRQGAENHWYAEWLFLRYLSEKYGHEVVRTIWEQSRLMDGFEAIDATLAPLGSSLEVATREFAIANLLRAYEEGNTYPVVRLQGEAGLGTFVPADGVQSLGADYVRLIGSGMVSVTLTQSAVPMTLRIVGVLGDRAEEIAADGNVLHINLDRYQAVYTVVHNDSRVADEDDCRYDNYALEIASSGAAPSSLAATWLVANFKLPSEAFVAAPTGEHSYIPPGDAPFPGGEFSDSPTDLAVPFETLIPATLPEGYYFDYAYIMTVDDFGENAIYYAPGGGDVANFDYLDSAGNWLSIAESPSPYATLEEWLTDIDYDTPGEFQQVSGVQVLVEDLSEGDSVWISITMIYKGLFVVIDASREDGNTSAAQSDALILVESLIAAGGEVPLDQQAAPTPQANRSQPELPQAEPLDESSSSDQRPDMSGPVLGALGLGLVVCGATLCIVAIPLVLLGVFVLLRSRKGG